MSHLSSETVVARDWYASLGSCIVESADLYMGIDSDRVVCCVISGGLRALGAVAQSSKNKQ